MQTITPYYSIDLDVLDATLVRAADQTKAVGITLAMALMSEGVVKYMADYYSSERVRDFMRKFFDELSVFIREANV